jgi:integrase
MASIIQIGDNYRAQVRRTGQPTMTKTFAAKDHKDPKKAAQVWANGLESTIASGQKVGIHGKVGITVKEAITLYINDKGDLSKSVVSALNSMYNAKLGTVALSKLSDDDIVRYIDGKEFGPATGAFHFANLRSVLKMASVGWGYHVPEVLDRARDRLNILGLIGKSQERDRRPTTEEITKLLAYDYQTKVPMADIIQFAMSSAMRCAEITRISHLTFIKSDRPDVRSTVVITDRKHPTKKLGNDQTVPLLDEAVAIIERQPKHEHSDCIFPYESSYISEVFAKACKSLGIEDLHFHDLRHEGASRLFEMGYQIHQVAMFTGHEDWKSLKRYTQLKARDLPSMKGEKTVEKTVNGMPEMDSETMKQFKAFMEFQKMMNYAESD